MVLVVVKVVMVMVVIMVVAVVMAMVMAVVVCVAVVMAVFVRMVVVAMAVAVTVTMTVVMAVTVSVIVPLLIKVVLVLGVVVVMTMVTVPAAVQLFGERTLHHRHGRRHVFDRAQGFVGGCVLGQGRGTNLSSLHTHVRVCTVVRRVSRIGGNVNRVFRLRRVQMVPMRQRGGQDIHLRAPGPRFGRGARC
jgi:hypothetical protein